MKYHVWWDSVAEIDVQGFYDQALDKELIRDVVVRIGLELSRVPLDAGESRGGNRRVLFKHPLIVWYTVNERLRTVTVTHVRLSRSR